MFERIRNNRRTVLALIGILVLLSVLTAWSLAPTSSTLAQTGPSSGDPLNPQSTAIFTCTISEIAVHRSADRIHIRCNPGTHPGFNDNFTFFAAPSGPADLARANQFLTLANTAYVLAKPIKIWYETDPALNPPGCLATDCRGIIALVLIQ